MIQKLRVALDLWALERVRKLLLDEAARFQKDTELKRLESAAEEARATVTGMIFVKRMASSGMRRKMRKRLEAAVKAIAEPER